ncbi:MAG TPA: 30S ribosomal protein S18 [Anaerolineales bacterium]
MSDEDQERIESGGPRRFHRKPRACQFCADRADSIDHKQAEMLKRFTYDSGKIRPRRDSGACARHQRMLGRAIKRARHLALLPYAADRFR